LIVDFITKLPLVAEKNVICDILFKIYDGHMSQSQSQVGITQSHVKKECRRF